MTSNLYTYSQLSSETVGRMVTSLYGLDSNLTCKFFVLGLHDNYLIECDNQKYIVRIYRNHWRTDEEIFFELDLLAYLSQKTGLAAKLATTINGDSSFRFECPEGPRLASMFHYADGVAPGDSLQANEAQLLGKSVAELHACMDEFVPRRARKALDIPYLLDDSVDAIIPFLDDETRIYLANLRDRIHISLPELDKTKGVYGLCIGDVNPTNFHIDKNRKITVFDFDQCGHGYRAFEIGKFYSSIRNHPEKDSIKDSFLRGYQSARLLNKNELVAVSVFEIISIIWVMAIQVANADRIGYKYLEKPYWDRRITDLKGQVSKWLERIPESIQL